MDLTPQLLDSRIIEEYIDRIEIPELHVASRFLIVGPSRVGKDTVAKYLSMNYPFDYNGPCSLVLCNLLFPEGVEELYSKRHIYKNHLFRFGNLLRDRKPKAIVFNVLQDSFMLVGARGWVDVNVALDEDVVRNILWVQANWVEMDDTIEFGVNDLLTKWPKRTTIINNRYNDFGYLFAQLDLYMSRFGHERVLRTQVPTYSRYNVNYFEH